jgi:salicylate hydroxylase
MADPRRAIVVGAGVGGLTAAIALAREGWRVRVFEQFQLLEPVGAGLQLGPNATRILRELDLLAQIRKIATEPKSLRVRNGASGRMLAEMALAEAAESRWGAPYLLIHRGDLHAALLAAALRQAEISVELGHHLDSLKFRESSVEATFTSRGRQSTAEAELLIGADGLWSCCRQLIGLPGPAAFSGCVAWRTLVPAEAAPALARELRANLWVGPGAHLVHYPIRGGATTNVVAIVEQNWRERGWSEPGERDWINARFKDWHGDARALIGAAEGWLRWSLFDRPPEHRWTRGRAALLGDAAHPMLPFLAQGAGQAIEDAGALLQALRQAPDPLAALKAYETARLPRAAAVQKASRRQAFAYHAPRPLSFARNAVIAALGGSGLARRYDWLYGAAG